MLWRTMIIHILKEYFTYKEKKNSNALNNRVECSMEPSISTRLGEGKSEFETVKKTMINYFTIFPRNSCLVTDTKKKKQWRAMTTYELKGYGST